MAADPGTMVALSITGNFTNTQYVGNYIDCTGLTFTVEYFSASSSTISGSSFINGTYSYSIYGTTITIVANPSLFSTTGEQNVIFNASQTLTLAEATATKSVTVQSLSITKNIYVFTNDGRRAIWGTIEEQSNLTEVTIVNPNNSAVFYNIPEGTSIYLDAAGTQPVVACQTKITGTTVYMSGDGDCEYIYNDGIKPIMIGPGSINKIDIDFLQARYNDNSLTTCVNTSYPVTSDREG